MSRRQKHACQEGGKPGRQPIPGILPIFSATATCHAASDSLPVFNGDRTLSAYIYLFIYLFRSIANGLHGPLTGEVIQKQA